MDLLSRTRNINNLLQKAAGKPVNFTEMAATLSEMLKARIYIISRYGTLFGFAPFQQTSNDSLKRSGNREFSKEYNKRLLTINNTISNLNADSEYAAFLNKDRELCKTSLITIIPIIGGAERLGTLILERLHKPFFEDELILAEYGSTVVGVEILRKETEEVEREARKKGIVQVALNSLSYSELTAIQHIFKELGGKDGLLVASKLADRFGITRSVIVNAIRKLVGAGVIESAPLE